MSEAALQSTNTPTSDFSPLLISAIARADLDEDDLSQFPPEEDRWGVSRSVVPRAVIAAFDLADRPSLARVMRASPLPSGVLALIQIAAGGSDTLRGLVSTTGRDPAFVRAAALVYIERILWAPESDHYRALGVNRDARPREIAKHLLWFAKWVSQEWGWSELEFAFAGKVLIAWDVLKSPRLRREYDLATHSAPKVRDGAGPKVSLVPSEHRIPWAGEPLADEKPRGIEPPAAEPWQIAFLGASLIAVVAVAMLNWIVFQIPASASAASIGRAEFELRMANPDLRPELVAERAQNMRTYVGRAKDRSRLVLTSGN